MARSIVNRCWNGKTDTSADAVRRAAALDGGWQMALGSDQTTIRDSVASRTDELFETWSPKRIEFEGGYDLDGDGILESSQTINTSTIGELIRPSVNRNLSNESSGDIVLRNYDQSVIPNALPGLPTGYDRSPSFIPDTTDPNSILVRLRRTDEQSIPGGTSDGNLPYLWSRGSLLSFGLKGKGIAVRSETIAKLSPATAVGSATNVLLPPVLAAAIPLTEIVSGTLPWLIDDLPIPPRSVQAVIDTPSATLTGLVTCRLPSKCRQVNGRIGFSSCSPTSA